MIGIPRVLQTKADFDDMEAMVKLGEVRAADLAKHYKGLLECRYTYVFDKILNSDGDSDADGDMPDYCHAVDPESEQITQLKRVEDPSARAITLGFTWDYIESRIKSLSGEL